MRESRPDLPLGTVTFLFTDIEGSTPLVSKIGPTAFRDVLERSHRDDARIIWIAVEVGTQGSEVGRGPARSTSIRHRPPRLPPACS
jgi:hypothetical protein